MVTCERCRGRPPERFSDRWVSGILGRFRIQNDPNLSKTLESGGKSSGKFRKTVGSQREVVPRGRGGEEGTGRAVDLSAYGERLAGFLHSITAHPSLRSRARKISPDCSAPVQDRRGRGSAAAMAKQTERLRHAAVSSRSGSIEGRLWSQGVTEPVCVSRVGERVNHIRPAESTEHITAQASG
jgi:hypothetical protein